MNTRTAPAPGPGSGSSVPVASRPRLVLVAAVIAVVFGSLGYLLGQSTAAGGDDPAASASDGNADGVAVADEDAEDDGSEEDERDGVEGVAARLAEQQEEERSQLVAELTGEAEAVHDELLPLLAQMNGALPVDDGEGQEPSADRVEAWRSTAMEASERFAGLGLGEGPVDVSVAGGAFTGSVRQLAASAATYQEAVDSDDADQRSRLTDLAATQRDDAVGLWTVGAEQLDVINIAVDGGHVHLYLPTDGDPGSLPDEFREPEGHDDLVDHDDHDDG